MAAAMQQPILQFGACTEVSWNTGKLLILTNRGGWRRDRGICPPAATQPLPVDPRQGWPGVPCLLPHSPWVG